MSSNIDNESRTTYSCWPGYTHVSGDLQRDCLPSLIWESRRPACVPVCDVAYPQSCKTCRASVFNKPNCSIVNQTYTTSDSCRNQQTLSPYNSVYYNGSVCLTYDCQVDISGSIAQDVFSLKFSCSYSKYLLKMQLRKQHIIMLFFLEHSYRFVLSRISFIYL